MDYKDLFLCNPEKAYTCKKGGCYANYGPCYLTSDYNYACCKNGEPIIAISKEQQDKIYDNYGEDGLSMEIEIAIRLAIAKFNSEV